MAVTIYGSYDAWQRHAYVSIESSSTVKMQYEALTASINIEIGERSVDIIDLLNMGQIMKYGPVGMTTITLEGYPLYAGTANTSGATRGTPTGGKSEGYWELFADIGHTDTAQPLNISMTNNATRYRIAILLTNDAELTGTLSAASNGTPSVTAGATTAGDHDGKMMLITSGTGLGGRYMIVTHTNVSVYTLTAGDTPATDLGGTTPNNTITVYPTGSGAVATGSKGKRFVMADCTVTASPLDFTDGILKQTVTIKGKMFAADGSALFKIESTDGTAQLGELGSYTAGVTYWS